MYAAVQTFMNIQMRCLCGNRHKIAQNAANLNNVLNRIPRISLCHSTMKAGARCAHLDGTMCWCRVIWTYICISLCNNCNIFTTLNTFLTGPNNNKPGQVRTVNKRRFTIDIILKNMSASQNFPMATFHQSHSSRKVREVGKQFPWKSFVSWWRHQMETFSALLAICAGNSPATGEFRAQRPVTRSFDVFCDLYLNKRLRKQSWDWWFETLWRPLWRHCNDRYCS